METATNVYFIDWQTSFAGNPLVDLAFLLYYTTDDVTPALERYWSDIYYQGLKRHGGLRPGVCELTEDGCYRLFEEALPFAFLRWACGSGSFRMYLENDEKGLRFQRLLARLPSTRALFPF